VVQEPIVAPVGYVPIRSADCHFLGSHLCMAS
jgi:hypothetical protein